MKSLREPFWMSFWLSLSRTVYVGPLYDASNLSDVIQLLLCSIVTILSRLEHKEAIYMQVFTKF